MNASSNQRRSFVQRRLPAAASARITGGTGLMLADLSLVPRWGVKGRDAFAWLAGQGASVPARDNSAERQRDGSLIARLSPGEALALASPPGGQSGLQAAIEALPPEGLGACYPVPRWDSHCWFAVAGADAPRTFAKLCAVDLAVESFPVGSVAQTSVARLSAIVIRGNINGAITFSLLADSAGAEYLWDCLIDAMDEFSGVICDIESLPSAQLRRNEGKA
jgi:sarcosine oxidase subunit gamma